MQSKIQHEVILTHSPEVIYQLLTKPELISRWFCDAVQPTPDGFHFWQRKPNGEPDEFHATVLESVPNKKVVLEMDDERMLQTRYQIQPESDKKCRVKIIESGFSNDAFGQATYQERQSSWETFIDRLKKVTVGE